MSKRVTATGLMIAAINTPRMTKEQRQRLKSSRERRNNLFGDNLAREIISHNRPTGSAYERSINFGLILCAQAIGRMDSLEKKNKAALALLEYIEDARVPLKDVKKVYETILGLDFEKSDELVHSLINPAFKAALKQKPIMRGSMTVGYSPYEVELAKKQAQSGDGLVARILGTRNMPTIRGFYKAALFNGDLRALKLAAQLREAAEKVLPTIPEAGLTSINDFSELAG